MTTPLQANHTGTTPASVQHSILPIELVAPGHSAAVARPRTAKIPSPLMPKSEKDPTIIPAQTCLNAPPSPPGQPDEGYPLSRTDHRPNHLFFLSGRGADLCLAHAHGRHQYHHGGRSHDPRQATPHAYHLATPWEQHHTRLASPWNTIHRERTRSGPRPGRDQQQSSLRAGHRTPRDPQTPRNSATPHRPTQARPHNPPPASRAGRHHPVAYRLEGPMFTPKNFPAPNGTGLSISNDPFFYVKKFPGPQWQRPQHLERPIFLRKKISRPPMAQASASPTTRFFT